MRIRETKDHNDPTQDTAIGSVDKEWKRMSELAIRLRNGKCNPTWAEEQEKKFIGIYKRLLSDPIDELNKEVRR